MRALFLLISFLLASPSLFATERKEIGNLVLENVPAIPVELREDLRQYRNTRAASFRGWLPSGNGLIIGTRFGETSQMHWVKAPAAARQQLSFFHEPVRGVTVNPVDREGSLIYSRDVGGSEYYQLFLFEMKTGKSRMLSDGKSRNQAVQWAPDGRSFVYSSNKRNGKDTDIWMQDIASGEETLLVDFGGVWFARDWSKNGNQLLITRYVSINESYLDVLDIKTGKRTSLNPPDRKVSMRNAIFDHKSKGVFFSSDDGTEFQTLRYYDLATGEARALTDDTEWDIEGLALSANGRYLAYTTNKEGVSQLYVRDLIRKQVLASANLPKGIISGLAFHPGKNQLAFTLNASTSPGDVYSLSIPGNKLSRWTYSETGGIPSDSFVEPEVIRFTTFDKDESGKQRKIPSFYYKPEGEGPFPVVIDIHGGPEGQERPGFNSFIQYLVNERKIAVLAPNVRGSRGFGKSYLKLDNGYKREDSVKDIGALLDWLGQQEELDSSRVVVYGGSYGGYMVLASMVHYNDRLSGGVDIVGISNFVTFLKNTKTYRRDLRRPEYGDERDPAMNEFLQGISPNNHAGKITKPLFVIQGLNDPRVPASEAEQMLAVMRENGAEPWYMLAKDEGHGFRKKGNRDHMVAAVILFLDQVFATSK